LLLSARLLPPTLGCWPSQAQHSGADPARPLRRAAATIPRGASAPAALSPSSAAPRVRWFRAWSRCSPRGARMPRTGAHPGRRAGPRPEAHQRLVAASSFVIRPSSEVILCAGNACCKSMFQVFQMFHLDVASVTCGCCICCNGCTRMLQAFVPKCFSCFSSRMLQVCLSKCCTCFTHMLHAFFI
jgi:hypothetical protein